MTSHDPDFRRIRPLNGDRRTGFEEFCAQLARHDGAPDGSRFVRLRGAGGDGGVECYWELPDGVEWGYQSKLLRRLDKVQLSASVKAALRVHPNLTRYVVCLPFDLTGPTGRSGSDQQTKWQEYVAEWEELAAAREVNVSFELWSKSELTERLVQIDPTGGRRRFWFDQEVLGADWFAAHISDAVSDAGPRYHPELTVEVPISAQLGAFGATPGWKALYSRRLKKFGKEVPRWRESAGNREEGSVRHRMEVAAPQLAEAHSQLSRLLGEETLEAQAVLDAVGIALCRVREAEEALRDELEAKHGEGAASNAAFRQYQAEFALAFPAADLDHARTLSEWLSEEMVFLDSGVLEAIERRTLLITGVAGAGKTHAICDVAEQRLKQGLLSIVILGEKLGEGDVFQQIREILGLHGDLSRDQLLAALDAAAESSGSPLIFFVDALNERIPRNAWKRDLASFINQALRFPNLRVCLSCRSTYLDVVLPAELELPQVEHRGFAGVELEAILHFFAWWELDPPAIPLLQPEFLNPLFLRMLCTGLSRAGRPGITDEPPSLGEVVELLLDSSEGEAEQRLDVDRRDRLVHRAVDAVISEMRRVQSFRLPWASVTQILEPILPGRSRSQSLFDFLLREGILREVQTVSRGSADEVTFGFERLGELLLAKALVSDVDFGEDLDSLFAARDRLAETTGGAAGLNEALAVLLPETIGHELIDVDRGGTSRDLLEATVDSLTWRAPGFVSERTKVLVREALETLHDPVPILDELFALAARADHPLGPSFLEELLGPLGQADRDELLCPYLHLSWEDQGTVHRLCAWATEPHLARPSADTAFAWASALAWCCAAADRRPRDHATMGMVALLERRSEVVAPLLDLFLHLDDDYIVERVLLASYGALIRANAPLSTEAAATTVYELLFSGTPPLNALIRDHGRSIIELAAHQGVLPEIDVARCLPPYGSTIPGGLLKSEDEEAIAGSGGSSDRDGLPEPEEEGPAWRSLWLSVDSGDFARYTMFSALKTMRREHLDLYVCREWIIEEVRRLGYDSRFDNYDGYMLHQFGGGRGRPRWAERVGKKYQWIALYRLIGLVADNVPIEPDPWEPEPAAELPPPLQAPGERNLDPTMLLRRAATDSFAAAWWSPLDFDFHPDLTPEEWLDRMDFPGTTDQVETTGADGSSWLTLHAYLDWDDRSDRTDYGVEHRRCWVHLRGYLVAREDSERFWSWLRKQDFHGDWMPKGAQWLSYVFAGEYPRATQALRTIPTESVFRTDRVPFTIRPSTYEQSMEFKFDSFHERAVNILLPAPELLSGRELRWDGSGGFRDENGDLRFIGPDLLEPGPQALLAERESFLRWLEENELAMFWTTLSEMHWTPEGFGEIHELGYAVHSRAHRLVDGALETSRGVTRRVRPNAERAQR